MLPLGATARRILTALRAGPLDAPSLLDALAALPDGRGAPRVARLHGVLDHLIARGLVVSVPPHEFDRWHRRRYHLPLEAPLAPAARIAAAPDAAMPVPAGDTADLKDTADRDGGADDSAPAGGSGTSVGHDTAGADVGKAP